MGRLALRLPGAVEHLITRLETGQIEVKLAPAAPRGGGRSRRQRHSRRNRDLCAMLEQHATVVITDVPTFAVADHGLVLVRACRDIRWVGTLRG